MTEQIVIFGGTFDPIHHGHLITARAVAEYFGFRKVTFMPAKVPPHKGHTRRKSAPASDRLEMVRLAVAGSEMFDVSDIEIQRSGPSYTIDTLTSLRRRYGHDADLYWIIGADMLEDLPTWRNADEVIEMARIITAARPPYSQRVPAVLENLRNHFTSEQVDRLADGVVSTPLIDISSTNIRRRLATGSKPIKYLTPDNVVDYIRKHCLYGAG
ncbi:MAG: nicotinate-nucleotide adenylyltransferase [Planctomycetota bacterium]|nr:nicotinate-nucleotide adenylyltransferase [Planctomycetota bacterium]